MDDQWCELHEQPFHSTTPFIGSLIVWFRTLWNNVATRWYVIPIIQQQTAINHRLYSEMTVLSEELNLLRQEMNLLRQDLSAFREELSGEQEIRHSLDIEMVTTRRDQAGAYYSLQTDIERLRARLDKAEKQLPKVVSR